MRMKDNWSSKDCQRLHSQTLKWNKPFPQMEASNPSRAHPWRQKVASYSLMVWLSPTILFSMDLCSYWPFLAHMCFVHHKYCCWFRFYPKMKISLLSCMKQQLPTIDFPIATITTHYHITGQKAVAKPFGMSSFCPKNFLLCKVQPVSKQLRFRRNKEKKGGNHPQKESYATQNGLHRLSFLMFIW